MKELILLCHWPSFWMMPFLTSQCSSHPAQFEFSLGPIWEWVCNLWHFKIQLCDIISRMYLDNNYSVFIVGQQVKPYLQTSPVFLLVPAVSYRLFIIVLDFKSVWLVGTTGGSMVSHWALRSFIFRTCNRKKNTHIWVFLKRNSTEWSVLYVFAGATYV